MTFNMEMTNQPQEELVKTFLRKIIITYSLSKEE